MTDTLTDTLWGTVNFTVDLSVKLTDSPSWDTDPPIHRLGDRHMRNRQVFWGVTRAYISNLVNWCRSQAQQACAKADVDVRLRRVMLRQFRGQGDDPVAGERCLYWREATDKFQTMKWKGWLLFNLTPTLEMSAPTGLLMELCWSKAGKHYVKRLVDAEGRTASPIEAMREVRQRRFVQMIDLHKTNKRSIDELDLDLDVKHRKHGEPPHRLQLHGPAQQESPELNQLRLMLKFLTAQPILMSSKVPCAIEQIYRPIEQLERPPDSPCSYAPTTPAETVIEENDEPNTNTNIDNNDDANANTTATLPANVPADMDLPRVPPSDDESNEDEMGGPSAAVNTLPAGGGEIPREVGGSQSLIGRSGPSDAAVNTVPASSDDDFRRTWRQIDQGEMAWLTNFQSQRRSLEEPNETPEQKCHKIQNSVEIGFYRINGEHNKVPAEMLPEGWTYDDVSNTFVLGETKDFGSVEDGFLVRNHVVARNDSWRPTAEAIKNVSIKLCGLQSYKITLRDGAAAMMVDSVAAAERRISNDAFFGKTLFPLNKNAVLKLKMPYINLEKKIHKSNSNFTDNSPSEVWMAATRP